MKKAVLFDFDGTIVDSSSGVMACFFKALESHGLTIPPALDKSAVLGPPIMETLSFFYPDLSVEDKETVYDSFRESYATTGCFEYTVYQGMPECIRRLSRSYALSVATNKNVKFARQMLDEQNLLLFFDGVYGASLERPHETKGDHIARAMKAHHYHHDLTLMVGDRTNDLRGAKQHSIRSIGVAWGFAEIDELSDADYVVDDSKTLTDLIENILR